MKNVYRDITDEIFRIETTCHSTSSLHLFNLGFVFGTLGVRSKIMMSLRNEYRIQTNTK